MKKIKLMADYQCHPLWDKTPGNYGDINPYSLPISENLKQQLVEWAHAYDATLNILDPARSGFKDLDSKVEFTKIGHEIAEKLQSELGPEFIITTKIAT